MNPKTEHFLYLMLWGAETLARPTFRTVTESFEGWAYRRGILLHLQRLEHRELIESKSDNTLDRIYRLTEAGRLLALGGCDPEPRWNRTWDGKWRMIAFDLPEDENATRVRLRRFLRNRRFGYLQKSLWISPDPLEEDIRKLSALGEDVESLLTLEAKPCSGESDESIVNGAWDFKRLGELHRECLALLNKPPGCKSTKAPTMEMLQQWAEQERTAWQSALEFDPLLPAELLPPSYVGRDVWKLRNTVLREAGRRLSQES